MSIKKLTRRDFLSKASVVFAGLGVPPWMRAEMLEAFAKRMIPESQADEGRIQRFIEICVRSGSPFINVGTGQDFMNLDKPNYSCSPYPKNQYIKTSGSSLILNNRTKPLLPYIDNIAITQGVDASAGAHTDTFNIRKGDISLNMTTPAVAVANKIGSRFSVVNGVNWYSSKSGSSAPANQLGIVNITNGLLDLVNIETTDNFIELFKKQTLRFNNNEAQAILDASKRLSKLQVERVTKSLKSGSALVESHAKGASLVLADYTTRLKVTGPDPKLLKQDYVTPVINPNAPNAGPGRLWKELGVAMDYTLRAFRDNLISTSTMTILQGDIHSYTQVIDQTNATTPLADSAENLASILAETIRFLKATPEPNDPSKTLWDTTVIACTTEFTRGISPVGIDNRDGSTDGFILIGKNVVGGYYGSFDLPGGTNYGEAYGFDTFTGAPRPGMKNKSSEAYNTLCGLLGLELRVPGTGLFSCMMRKA